MINIEYSNNETNEKVNVSFPNEEKVNKVKVFYVDYSSEDFYNWTSSYTYAEILKAYEDGKVIYARATVPDSNFEGTPIEAQTRIIRLHKITPNAIEFIDLDFYDGNMESIRVKHTESGEITIRSLIVH